MPFKIINSTCIAIALALPVLGAAVAQELPTVELGETPNPEVRSLALVEDYLNSIETLRARFVQDSPDGKRLEGKLFLERPGRVRFEYDEPVPYLIVSDGEILNLIDYEVGQITRWPIKETPLALLVAEEIDLSRDVEIEQLEPGALANFLSVTARDPKNPTQGTLTLTFEQVVEADGSGTRLDLLSWRVIDAQGGLTTVRLFDREANVAIEPERWAFKDPRGERVRRRPRR